MRNRVVAESVNAAEARIAKSQQSEQAFARIRDQFVAMRRHLPPGEARDRVDRTIELNDQTRAAVRRTQLIAEGELARAANAARGERKPA
jgi:hypothetical protein